MFGGAEYAQFAGAQTYFVQAGGIANVGNTTSTWQGGGFVRGGLRHFFSDDAMLSVEGTVGFGGFSSSTSGVYGAWGVEFERQIAGTPISYNLFYRGAYVEDSSSGSTSDLVDSVFGVGISVIVGRDSLLASDRDGAETFDLPNFHRPISWPDNL